MLTTQIASFLTFLLLLHFILNFFSRGLQRIPGPPFAKVSNVWRLVETWKGRYDRTLQGLHRRYGSVVRVGPNSLSIADPDAIESIYGTKTDLPKVSHFSNDSRRMWEYSTQVGTAVLTKLLFSRATFGQ